MNPETPLDSAGPAAAAVPRKPAPAYFEFLKCLGQSAKVVSLYKASHPIAAASLAETGKAFERLSDETRADHITLGFVEDRWIVNGAVVAEAAQAPEVLRTIFRTHAIGSLTFRVGLRVFELAAFSELAALAPNKTDPEFLTDFLSQRGVKNIRTNADLYAKAQPKSESPAAPSRPLPESQVKPISGENFGDLLKNLVETAVVDPGERTRIYSDTLRLVKVALDRHVNEATKTLREEKQVIIGQQARAEQVLSTVAEGKVTVDANGKVLMMNPAAEGISGKRLSDMAGKSITEGVDPSEQVVSLSRDLTLKPGQPASREVRVLAEDAVEQAFRQSIALIQDEAGHLVGTYSVLPAAAKYKETINMQREFISRVTHELNAPLASIIAGLGILSDKLKGGLAAEEERFLTACRRNSERLRLMVRDILDFSKLEAGKMSATIAPTPVGPLLKETVEGMRPWSISKGQALTAAPVPEGLASVMADPTRIIQVLTNLISNAIKATPSGGQITVSASAGTQQHAGSVVFAVKDNGCGIARENLDRIFQKFLHISGEKEYREGVGLGLSIVRELLLLHGGVMWVESEKGRGTTFFFTLPAAKTAAAAGLA